MSRFSKYRRYIQPLIGVGMSCLFGASLLPQTLLLSNYKEAISSYDNLGNVREVPQDLREVYEKLVDHMDLIAEEEANLELFSCFGCDTLHRGSVKLRTGAVIGVPETYAYKSIDEVDLSRMAFGDRGIDTTSSAAVSLKEALLLSKHGRAFGIARELMYADTYHVWMDGGLRAFLLYVAYATGRVMRLSLGLDHRLKPWARGALYMLIGGAGACLYIVLIDVYHCWSDGKADSRAGRLHPSLLAGGLEYYDSALKRNVALRELLPDGPSRFTARGNVTTTLRRPAMELTARRMRLAKMMEEVNSRPLSEIDEVESRGESSEQPAA